MFSEKQIDNLLIPIVNLEEDFNVAVLRKIARKIKHIYDSDDDIYGLRSHSKYDDFDDDLELLIDIQCANIEKMIMLIAKDNYIDSDVLYAYALEKYIPFKENEPIQNIVNEVTQKYTQQYINRHKSLGFIVKKLNSTLKEPQSVKQSLKTVTDEAIQVKSSKIDFNVGIRKTIKQLIHSGLKSFNRNSETDTYDIFDLVTTVQNDLYNAVTETNQRIQDEIGNQVNANGVELSVHINPAPDHAPVQGHQFSKKEFEKMQSAQDFEDYLGNKFLGFIRPIGWWNCRHYTMSVILGVTKPHFNDKQLSDILSLNEKGYTFPSGKHLTLYQCLQRQHIYENKIRSAKIGFVISKDLGDSFMMSEYSAKISQYMQEYKLFSNACGLGVNESKIFVIQYDKK